MVAKYQQIGNRALIGVGIVAAIGLSIELGAWAVFALFGLVAAIGLYEACVLFARGGKAVWPWLVYGLGGVLYAGVGCVSAGASSCWSGVAAVAAGLSGVAVGLWLPRLQTAGPVSETAAVAGSAAGRTAEAASGCGTAAGAAWSVWAAVYVALPLALLTGLERVGMIWPLFLVIWANDVFAYLVGSSFKAEKRHKLAPRISPNKSWEGAAGGFCAALATGLGWALWRGTPVAATGVFAAVVAVAGVLGDLLESHYKRRAGLKDSGTLLGGHGGILDRFDSVLTAAPAAALLLATALLLAAGD